MDIRKVKKLIEMLENSSLNEIVIKEGEESVKLVKSAGSFQTPQMITPSPQVMESPSSETETKKETSETAETKVIDGKSIILLWLELFIALLILELSRLLKSEIKSLKVTCYASSKL